MFEEPEEKPAEHALDPGDRAREKCDEFRMHAELVAVFEGCRKFEAEIRAGLDPDLARQVQRGMARLEKQRFADRPVLKEEAGEEAGALLSIPEAGEVSSNDYHIYRRPGEVMIVRWLEGDLVDAFYERLQAHFDAALNQYRDEEKSTHSWKQDEKTAKYLEALDAIEVSMADRYLRELIGKHKLFVLSTQTADEMDILHLCDFVMGASAAQVVGAASAPPEEASERDRAWFFKMFSLRGMVEGTERMCFFTYLQKTEDTFESD